MNNSLIYLLPLTVPAGFLLLAALLNFRLPALRQQAGALAGLALLPTLFAVAAALVWMASGPGQSTALSVGALGIGARIDALSVTLLLLVSFLGAAVLTFSSEYLAGDPLHGRFMARLATTLAAVTLLVIADNLYQLVASWVAMSLSLHGLLLFRPERPGAVLAARKKFWLARVSDVSLLVAVVLLVDQFGTANLSELSTVLRQSPSSELDTSTSWAIALIALAAVLKSAQFPAHGWLVEVMETPTPVSALLHAGVVNAGGFLLLRFAELLVMAPAIMLGLATVGAVTAAIGSVVMLTRTDQKGSLAYSTVAQMGFMIFQCGLGAFSAAGLHLVGHSLYKAYAFLSSGEAVKKVAYNNPAPAASGNLSSTALRITILVAVIAVYCAIGLGFDSVGQAQSVVFALGLIFMLGLGTFLAAGVGAADWTRALTLRVTGSAALLSCAYFGLQSAAAWLLAGSVPAASAPGPAAIVLLAAVLILFFALAVLQLGTPRRLANWALALRIHVGNGLYINLLVNRLLGAYRHSPTARV